jgi:Flp pilus assembly CpaF family ATPase
MLNSGHSGFMCTVHANTPDLALSAAIPQNIVMSGNSIPNVKELLYQLVDLTIQLHRTDSGKRQVTEILFPKTKRRELLCH